MENHHLLWVNQLFLWAIFYSKLSAFFPEAIWGSAKLEPQVAGLLRTATSWPETRCHTWERNSGVAGK